MKFKKEELACIYENAKKNLYLMQGAIKEYRNTESIYIKRAIIGYFQDFSEDSIYMAETYLVMSGNYIDGYSGVELIKKSSLYGFIDNNLSRFLETTIKLRNRYTHDYYKRERVEEDILDFAINRMELLEIFLKVTEEKVKLDANNI